MMTYVLSEAALPYILETYPRGRETVTYSPDGAYSPDKHYVLVESPAPAAAGRLAGMGFKAIEDYYDKTNPYMWGLPVDWKFGQARIGKCTFYNSAEFDFAARMFFESVGRFTSINETAYFQHDHPLNMLGTGRFQQLFSFEDQGRYFQKVREDSHITNPGEKIVIGSDVWIGAGAFIDVSRCRSIGDGAIIAAGAVVLDDVEPYAVVAGAPARVKKYRYTAEEREILMRVRWWDWSDDEIRERASLLLEPKLFFEKYSRA